MGHSISIVALRNICNESVYNGIRRHLRRVSPRFVKNDALACEFFGLGLGFISGQNRNSNHRQGDKSQFSLLYQQCHKTFSE